MDVCIYSPFVIIVSAIGNQDPEMDDFSLIKWCKSKVKYIKVIEATSKVFFQCRLGIVFYNANKAYFECPRNEFFPCSNNGTVLIISIILSILPIRFFIIALFITEIYIRNYCKHWRKVWKRKDALERIWLDDDPIVSASLVIGIWILIFGINIF